MSRKHNIERMTDKFSILSIEQLYQMIQNQLIQTDSIFGFPKSSFYSSKGKEGIFMKRFAKVLETPFGVAAGPHSQLAQNIIAAWLNGARFIELKTIQTLDEIEVSKPCIDMQDEGYNCEWSQELKISDSLDQYITAWVLIHVLNHQLNGNSGQEPGFIFNMSVGYNMEGILNENVQWFLDTIQNAKELIEKKKNALREYYLEIDSLHIDSCMSDNLTLSTMHGTPPEEIEKIATYLIEEKGLHTTVKLNPTLLGKELREILNDARFEAFVPDEAFAHDLKYEDAVPMLRRLQAAANKKGVQFGIKLTNTLESVNHKDVFPASEKMMYMSGKSLHPISIQIAKMLQDEFEGKMDISFSGGLTTFNISDVVACGLLPATVCTDILKPGGYGLLKQYAETLESDVENMGAAGIFDFIRKKSGVEGRGKAILINLNNYADKVLVSPLYKKDFLGEPNIKGKRSLGNFDCIAAPCTEACATDQDVPDYMYYTARGEFEKAYDVIVDKNPFPHTTGMVCDHLCHTKCTRINYEETLNIRGIKRFVSQYVGGKDSRKSVENIAKKVSIIGAGVAGLSAAYYLIKGGFEVNVYEAKSKSGGMVSAAIPHFRLPDEDFALDVNRILKMGVKIHFNHKVEKSEFQRIQKEADYLFIAAGAQDAKWVSLPGMELDGVIDPLQFLYEVKEGTLKNKYNNILIIGGGNTAMDAARTAYRMLNKGGRVRLLYRRTLKEMPADKEEIRDVIAEGIEVLELMSPVEFIGNNNRVAGVKAQKMTLGEKDESGRRRPIPLEGQFIEFEADLVIPAFGQSKVLDFIDDDTLNSDDTLTTNKENIFIGGDALNGGLSIIQAVADGKNVAKQILERNNITLPSTFRKERTEKSKEWHYSKRSTKKVQITTKELDLSKRQNFDLLSETYTEEEAMEEASRCLLCDEVCNICTTVCPNLALYSYDSVVADYPIFEFVKKEKEWVSIPKKIFSISQKLQILHLADWCNECGNCNTFCPTAEAPYKSKPHLYLDKEAYDMDSDCYYLDTKTSIRYKDKEAEYVLEKTEALIKIYFDDAEYSMDKDFYTIEKIKGNKYPKDSQKWIEMLIVLEGAKIFR